MKFMSAQRTDLQWSSTYIVSNQIFGFVSALKPSVLDLIEVRKTTVFRGEVRYGPY
jgi:hypothetical protein